MAEFKLTEIVYSPEVGNQYQATYLGFFADTKGVERHLYDENGNKYHVIKVTPSTEEQVEFQATFYANNINQFETVLDLQKPPKK